MKMMQRIAAVLMTTSLLAEPFTPTAMQYGCRNIPAYEKADGAKGYGAQQLFIDADCVYLKGIDLKITEVKQGFLKVCNVHNTNECHWTPDTRP